MRKIIYSVAMSLDGYLAGPDGEVDWIVMDPEIDFGELMGRFDTLIMGRHTYEVSLELGNGEPMPEVETIVFSSTLRPEDHPGATIRSDDVGTAVSALRSAPGKDIWLFGGGSLFRSLLDLGLVDGVEVAIIPVLLGSGIPLLPERSSRSRLKLKRQRIYETTGTVFLEYSVTPDGDA